MRKLLVISSAPAVLEGSTPYLDVKFCEGMRYYCENWDGAVSCLLPLQTSRFPFGASYDPAQLPFELGYIAPDDRIGEDDIRGFDLVLCSGDNFRYLHVADICRKMNVKLVYIIEYILETRLQFVQLDNTKGLVRKVYSGLWNIFQEGRRRRAFRRADGLQANGYPAFEAYRRLNSNTLLYLDNRLRIGMVARPQEMEARRRHLTAGGRLRLIHSGRLEPYKGSQDLVPIARRLAQADIDFEIDIFGAGSLEGEIRQGIDDAGLQDRIRLHGVVDFETELVPFTRQNADIFLSCHRQSDPSCTYIEAMGCGVAVAGYANRMWAALSKVSEAGWVAPLGNWRDLADILIHAARDPDRTAGRAEAGLRFAKQRSFEREFSQRMTHLRETLARD